MVDLQGDATNLPTFSGWFFRDKFTSSSVSMRKTGWWFQIFFFQNSPLVAEMIQFDYTIFFQIGWLTSPTRKTSSDFLLSKKLGDSFLAQVQTALKLSQEDQATITCGGHLQGGWGRFFWVPIFSNEGKTLVGCLR